MQRTPDLLARATRRRLALPARGVEIAWLDWGGSGPLALLHHANGFCKGIWAPVAEALRRRFRVVAMDARGHGDSTKPEGRGAYDWDQFALDLGTVAEHLAAEHASGRVALGIGHSFGGTALLGASARWPALFERIVLVDPVTPPPPEAPAPPERSDRVRELAERARRRRSQWPSREAARASWVGRDLFSAWTAEALDLYVQDGLRDRDDGSVELKCPGEVEATIFASGDGFDAFALARGVATPALLLWATLGSFPRPVYEALASAMQDARVEAIACGHLVPMERPDLLAEAVLRFVDRPA